MSGQKSVAFMNHKTWHPTTFQNMEKVWGAEKRAEEDQKALEKVRKELAEEREIEGLRRQHETATGKQRIERVDFMYRTSLATDGADPDQYLMGKKFEEDKKKSDIHTVASKPGSLYLNSTPDALSDTRAKVLEDPLFAIKQQEVQKKRDVISNPVKMQRIIGEAKEDVLRRKLLEQMALARKKAKKEEKKRRKEEEEKAKSIKVEAKAEPVKEEESNRESKDSRQSKERAEALGSSKSDYESRGKGRREKGRRDESEAEDANERPKKRAKWSEEEKEGMKDSHEADLDRERDMKDSHKEKKPGIDRERDVKDSHKADLDRERHSGRDEERRRDGYSHRSSHSSSQRHSSHSHHYRD